MTIEKFMEGWFTDDLDMILSACADDFVYDDAMDGRFTKAEFPGYWRGLPDGDADHSDAVLQEVDGEENGLAGLGLEAGWGGRVDGFGRRPLNEGYARRPGRRSD